jgi:hypothetical protein
MNGSAATLGGKSRTSSGFRRESKNPILATVVKRWSLSQLSRLRQQRCVNRFAALSRFGRRESKNKSEGKR